MKKVKTGFYILLLLTLLILALLTNNVAASKLFASMGIIFGAIITYDLSRTKTQHS